MCYQGTVLAKHVLLSEFASNKFLLFGNPHVIRICCMLERITILVLNYM